MPTNYPPNTVHLGGPMVRNDDYVISEIATPGHQVELVEVSGKKKWRKTASATENAGAFILLDRPLMNKNIDDNYAAGDQAEVAQYSAGGFFYGLVPSGQNISNGELLAPNGDGTFKSAATTTAAGNVARYRALQNLGLIVALTRCRIEVLY